MRKFLVVAALATATSAATNVPKSAPTTPSSVRTELLRTSRTISGQPLRIAQSRVEMVASTADFPPNGRTTIHEHPWSRFVYVELGPLWVTNFDRHRTDEFQTGQVFAEAVGEWHEGRAGPKGARLIVFDLVPPGTNNVVDRQSR